MKKRGRPAPSARQYVRAPISRMTEDFLVARKSGDLLPLDRHEGDARRSVTRPQRPIMLEELRRKY